MLAAPANVAGLTSWIQPCVCIAPSFARTPVVRVNSATSRSAVFAAGEFAGWRIQTCRTALASWGTLATLVDEQPAALTASDRATQTFASRIGAPRHFTVRSLLVVGV